MKLSLLIEGSREIILRRHILNELSSRTINKKNIDTIIVIIANYCEYLDLPLDSGMNILFDFILKKGGELIHLDSEETVAAIPKSPSWAATNLSYFESYKKRMGNNLYVLIYRRSPLFCFGEMGDYSIVSYTHKKVMYYKNAIVTSTEIKTEGLTIRPGYERN